MCLIRFFFVGNEGCVHSSESFPESQPRYICSLKNILQINTDDRNNEGHPLSDYFETRRDLGLNLANYC